MKYHPIIRIISTVVKASLLMEAVNIGLLGISKWKAKRNSRDGQFYDWKFGKVFYSVKGRGTPLIMLHGFKPADSGNDMELLANRYCGDHRVFVIDLPGYGLSEKPWITYTNYFYVMFIRDFINEVIEEDCADIIACEGSCLVAVQARKALSGKIGNVTLIDPCEKENVVFPKSIAKRIKNVVDFPLYGTFLYNMYSLACGVPFDGAGRHVFVSRLSGHLTTDINEAKDLIDENVKVISTATEKQPVSLYE